MRVVFMGTPDFAVPVLAAIGARTDLAEVAAVVTQPDRPRGRGQRLVPSPVKSWAAAHDIPVHGCINVHASLLPKYRGAAPIQHAIMDGETVTGITTMQMNAGLDTGDMLLRREVPIHADTTYGTLHDVLMETGAELLIETLERLAAGTLAPVPQMGESSYAARITRETAQIDWSKPARELDALVRGLNPTPYAQTSLDGAVYKIGGLRRTGRAASAPAGTLVSADRRAGLCIAAGDEDVEITEIQAPGKKMMAASAFLNGCALTVGTRFSS